MIRRYALLGSAAGLVLLLGACGGDDDETSTETATGERTGTVTTVTEVIQEPTKEPTPTQELKPAGVKLHPLGEMVEVGGKGLRVSVLEVRATNEIVDGMPLIDFKFRAENPTEQTIKTANVSLQCRGMKMGNYQYTGSGKVWDSSIRNLEPGTYIEGWQRVEVNQCEEGRFEAWQPRSENDPLDVERIYFELPEGFRK